MVIVDCDGDSVTFAVVIVPDWDWERLSARACRDDGPLTGAGVELENGSGEKGSGNEASWYVSSTRDIIEGQNK